MLARACENEAENAKRMRMGLEPVSQSVPSSLAVSPALDSLAQPGTQQFSQDKPRLDYKAEQLVSLLSAAQQPQVTQAVQILGLTFTIDIYYYKTGLFMYRCYYDQVQICPGSPPAPAALDVLKKAPLVNHKLSGTEMTAVRQLITGYRESAAFLLRYAIFTQKIMLKCIFILPGRRTSLNISYRFKRNSEEPTSCFRCCSC